MTWLVLNKWAQIVDTQTYLSLGLVDISKGMFLWGLILSPQKDTVLSH